MARTAHFRNATEQGTPMVTVRDDRGVPLTELELPSTIEDLGQVDGELRAAGFARSADWTEADDGWVVPVVAEE